MPVFSAAATPLVLILVSGFATASAQQSTATVALRIGAIDGPEALGQIEAIAVAPNGHIYVLEGDAHRVLVFSETGSSLTTFGRQGAGPGEFRNPVGMTWAPDGRLWVIDPANNRASVFDTSGLHVTDHQLAAGFELAPWPGRFDRDGRFYHYAADADAADFGYVMVRYDASMRALDTLIPPPPPELPQFFETRTARWGTVRAAVPFTPRLIWRLGSDGQFWWAWTARYEIFHGNQSSPIIARRVDPVPVTGAARQAAIDGLDRFQQVGGRIDVARIPRERPALQGFFLDDLDRVWTIVTTDGGGRVLEIHSPNGAFMRRVAIPVALRPSPQPVVRGDLVYGVEFGEFDEPYVVVLRIGS